MRNFIRTHLVLFKIAFFSVIITCLLVAQTAFWLNRNIYNTDKFGSIATEAITQESSRRSIAQAIVNKLLQDRPVINGFIGSRLVGLTSGLLGTDQANRLIERVTEQAQILVTTPRREPITFDISAIKSTLISLQTILETDQEQRRVDQTALPDQITLVDTSKIPNFYTLGIVMLWLGPLCLVLVLGLAGWWIYRGSSDTRIKRIRAISGVIIISALLALLIGPLVRPPFMSIADTVQAQTLLGNVYDAFMAPFNNQARNTGILGVVLLAGTYAWQFLVHKSPLFNKKRG